MDGAFAADHTVGYDELEAVVGEYPPDRVADICGIPRAAIEQAAEWTRTTDRMVSTVLQGFFYKAVEATAASSLVNTVRLLRGAIGRPGAGPLLMAG